MIEFSNCCWCVPLRIGCLILGYLQLIASIHYAVILIVALVAVTYNTQVNENAVAVIASLVIVFILITVVLIFSLLLVIGIHKDRRSYVKAYLIYYSIIIVLLVIMWIVGCCIVPDPRIIGIVGLIYILPNVYYLLVIRSYWVTMGTNLNGNMGTNLNVIRS